MTMNFFERNPYDEAKECLAEGLSHLGKDTHEDVVIHDRRLYRVVVQRLRDPKEIDKAIRSMTEEATQ